MTTTSVNSTKESQPLLHQTQPSSFSKMCQRVHEFVMGDSSASSETLLATASNCYYGSGGNSSWAFTLEPDNGHWRDDSHYPRVLTPFGYYTGETWYQRSVSQLPPKLDLSKGG